MASRIRYSVAMRRHVLCTLALALTVGVALAGCATDLRGTRLALQTETVSRGGACDGAAMAPVRIQHDGDAAVFVDVGTHQEVSVIWPFGFAAWLEFGAAVLYARDGEVVGREGAVLDTIGGSAADDGFHVCQIGVRTYS